MSAAPDPIRCTDACKRQVPNMDAALANAWTFLEISKRWRCPECARELRDANQRDRGWGEEPK